MHALRTWISAALALAMFAMLSLQPAAAGTTEVFDGPKLYTEAFEYVRDNHLKLIDPTVRAAWAAEWESKFNGKLGSEQDTDEAITALIESVKAMEGPTERFDMYIVPQGTTDPILVPMNADAVVYKDLGNGIAYVRINGLLTPEVEAKLKEALTKVRNEKQKLILDLRGNRGGYTESGVRITGMMLPQGKIFATETRTGNTFDRFELTAEKNYNTAFTRRAGIGLKQPVPREELLLPKDTPIVVLTDEKTASAAEIIAGALKFNKRAITIGQRTFGKGVGQAIQKLSYGRVLHVTTFTFLPAAVPINAVGIQPDIVAVNRPGAATDVQLSTAIEHLRHNGTGVTVPAFTAKTVPVSGQCVAPPTVAPTKPEFSGGEPSPAMQHQYHVVWEYIRDHYYDPARLKDWDALEHAYDDKLSTLEDVNIALKELTARVGDKWTFYASQAEVAAAAPQGAAGTLHSGLRLQKNGGARYQIDVIDYGSSAYGSALRERDEVTCVNGVSIDALSRNDVDSLLKGKLGDKVVVRAINRANQSEYAVELTIAQTPGWVVEAKLLPGKIAYIRLPTFDGEQYLAAFVAEFERLRVEAGGTVNGVIVDLRNNQGGELPAAVKFASLFIDNPNAIAVKSLVRENGVQTVTDLRVHAADQLIINRTPINPSTVRALQQAPLVVLANGSSASASEVTLGALKDNNRGTIIGVTTFGKGVGYKSQRGPVGGIISVTGMSYLTPNGDNVQGRGIDPHVTVDNHRDNPGDDLQLKAAFAQLAK